MNIEELKGGIHQESLIAKIACQLMHGVCDGGDFVKLVKLNDMSKPDDEAMYEVDYGLTVNGEIAGYIDVEKKPGWKHGQWPYPRTNIAKHPMQQWERGEFLGTSTIKLQRFSKLPHTSFWVAARADWEAFWIMQASEIFEFGVDDIQPTRYSKVGLPVVALDNRFGTFCDDPDEFTAYILSRLRYEGAING